MQQERLGLNATWAMAVGGMVGGGIFSVLGVVIDRSGSLAWAAFLVGGAFALATGDSYSRLGLHFREGGGAFTYLRHARLPNVAGGLSWLLILGYVLTMAVYAFTFSHYAGRELGLGPLTTRALAVAVIAFFVAVNLRGVGGSARIEVVIVWAKVGVLFALGVAGLARWDSAALSEGVATGDMAGVLVGAATVFMAYEGFQLLTYDYDIIDDVRRTLPLGITLAVISVAAIYVLVAIGAAMLVGAGTLAEQRETALTAAGDAVLGQSGRVAVVVAAAFSAGSAINATLFATARLARRIAEDGELPAAAMHMNSHDVPDRSVFALGAAAAALAAIGSLGSLVEAASLTFLLAFAAVNFVAAYVLPSRRWVAASAGVGMLGGAATLGLEIARSAPLVLVGLAAMIVVAIAGRHAIVERVS
jgi:amino acid transporter